MLWYAYHTERDENEKERKAIDQELENTRMCHMAMIKERDSYREKFEMTLYDLSQAQYEKAPKVEEGVRRI